MTAWQWLVGIAEAVLAYWGTTWLLDKSKQDGKWTISRRREMDEPRLSEQRIMPRITWRTDGYVYVPPSPPSKPERHKCVAERGDGWKTIGYTTSCRSEYPVVKSGTIWQCDECGRYWFKSYLDMFLWRKVRRYHLRKRYLIMQGRRAEAWWPERQSA